MRKIIKLEYLTLKDMIETLVTYNIEHCKFPHNYMSDVGYDIPKVLGLSMDDKKLILIDKEQSLENTRQIIIHEFLHTLHYRKGDLTAKETESRIIKETSYNYKKLYGVNI